MAAAAALTACAESAAVALPVHVNTIEADDVRIVPLYIPEVQGAAALKLKLRAEGDNEVLQVWEHPEEEKSSPCSVDLPAATPSSSSSSSLQIRGRGRSGGKGSEVGVGGDSGGHSIGKLKTYKPGFPSPVVYHFLYRQHLKPDEESTIKSGRHTNDPAANFEWSANILSIKVISSTVGYPLNLYGCVYVRDDLDRRRVYLFRRDRDDPQLVTSPEETLVLTGPTRGLLVFDNLFFEVDLKMRCDQQVDDMIFSQGSMHYRHLSHLSWIIEHRSSLLIDELETNLRTMEEPVEEDDCISVDLSTRLGTLEFQYALVRRAVEATIQIKAQKDLLACHENGVSSLKGKIVAFISDISEEIVLFDSESFGTVIKIGDDGLFELWRSVISVPIDGSLVLRVDTWEGDCQSNLSSCSSTFTPQVGGEDVAPCAAHKLRVKVDWSPLFIAKVDNEYASLF